MYLYFSFLKSKLFKAKSVFEKKKYKYKKKIKHKENIFIKFIDIQNSIIIQ